MAANKNEGAVQVALPPGMTQEEFLKAFASFQKQRVSTTIRDKATRSATKDLIAAHKTEFDGYLKKYMPKGS